MDAKADVTSGVDAVFSHLFAGGPDSVIALLVLFCFLLCLTVFYLARHLVKREKEFQDNQQAWHDAHGKTVESYTKQIVDVNADFVRALREIHQEQLEASDDNNRALNDVHQVLGELRTLLTVLINHRSGKE